MLHRKTEIILAKKSSGFSLNGCLIFQVSTKIQKMKKFLLRKNIFTYCTVYIYIYYRLHFLQFEIHSYICHLLYSELFRKLSSQNKQSFWFSIVTIIFYKHLYYILKSLFSNNLANSGIDPSKSQQSLTSK